MEAGCRGVEAAAARIAYLVNWLFMTRADDDSGIRIDFYLFRASPFLQSTIHAFAGEWISPSERVDVPTNDAERQFATRAGPSCPAVPCEYKKTKRGDETHPNKRVVKPVR